MSIQAQVTVWLENQPISTTHTLTYSVLEVGDGLDLFLGHTPSETLVNIQRLQDALDVLKYRTTSE